MRFVHPRRRGREGGKLRSRWPAWVMASALTMASASPLWGGCIRVVVRDPAGLAIQNARVHADGQQTPTDERGSAKICELGPGPHRVTVKAENFRKSSRFVEGTEEELVFQASS